MKPRRVRFELCPVPSGYEPGYPAGLTPAQYRELLLPGTCERLHGLAAAMLLVGGGQRALAQEPESTREERVLALVQGLGLGRQGWLARSTFQLDREKGAHVVLPRIPIMFGNSYSGLFDAASARRIALEAFRAYGLDPRTDVALEQPGLRGVLDGLDEARRVGFELSGLPDPRAFLGAAEVEPAETGLDVTHGDPDLDRRQGRTLLHEDVDPHCVAEGVIPGDDDQGRPVRGQLHHGQSLVHVGGVVPVREDNAFGVRRRARGVADGGRVVLLDPPVGGLEGCPVLPQPLVSQLQEALRPDLVRHPGATVQENDVLQVREVFPDILHLGGLGGGEDRHPAP